MTNELVRKSNYLNQFTCYKSTPQLKIFSILLSEIKRNPNQEVYRLYIQDIFKEFGGSQENYNQLKSICKQMMKVIDIPKERGFCLKALFYKIDTTEKGVIEFTVNPELIPQLLVLSEFTSYYLKNIMHLKSAYSIRIYELLKQYANQENRGWWKVSIEDLRDILGIDKKQYKLYADFKRKVILVAQREIKETTDTAFDFEEHKRGRKVEKITFHIKDNTAKQNQALIQIEEKEKNYSIATTTLIRFGIPTKKALELYEQKGEEFLIAILNKWVTYLENEKMPDGSKIKSTKATLLWAIENEDKETEFEKEKKQKLKKQQELQNEDLRRRNEEMKKALEEKKEKEKREQIAKEEYANTSKEEITTLILERLQQENKNYKKLSQESKEQLKQMIFENKEKFNTQLRLHTEAVVFCLRLHNQEEQEQNEVNTKGIASLKSVIQESFLKEDKNNEKKKK